MPSDKPVRTYLSDEDMKWIRAKAREAYERFGIRTPPSDAAIVRAAVAVAKRHEDELMAELAADPGFGRRPGP